MTTNNSRRAGVPVSATDHCLPAPAPTGGPDATRPGYTYARDRDGTSDTFNIRHPGGHVVATLHFWDEPDTAEAADAEASARAVCEHLTRWHPGGPGGGPVPTVADRRRVLLDRLRDALDYLLEQTVDMALADGIALTEGEADARRVALAVMAEMP